MTRSHARQGRCAIKMALAVAQVAGVLLLGCCRATPNADLPGLAERPPLPWSVLVTGGAFVEPPTNLTDEPRARTFADTSGEALELEALVQVLARGRVFVRSQADAQSSTARAGIATATQPGELQQVMNSARLAGHDYLLVIERVDDGPIETLGVNGQWPITLATWLLVGIGAVIPDHTYESRASLRASLRDAQDGHAVQELLIGTGTVDLSLLERTSVWGWVQSILIPPFWVGDDPPSVLAQVQPIARQRLMLGLAQRLKSVDVADRLVRNQPAAVDVQRVAGGLRLDLVAQEAISFLRLRLDDRALTGAAFDSFHRALLASRTPADRGLRYTAVLPFDEPGERLQVLIQTTSGRTGSVTVAMRGVR